MNTNMFKEYYNYKVKTIYQYSVLLSKIFAVDNNKMWHRKKDIEESLYNIVKRYFNKIVNENYISNNFVRMFIDNKEITNYYLDKELLTVVEYFIDNNEAFEIPAYEKEIILIASILKMANSFDISTSPFKKNKNNYSTIVKTAIEKFNKIEFLQLIDDGKKETKLLEELIKTNVRKERKIFDLLTTSNSFNRYVSISKENQYFLAQYNYNVNNLNKYDKVAIKMIYEKDNIDDKYVNISCDLIVITLMKMLSMRKNLKSFFLPVKEVFFEDEENLKKLDYVFKDEVIKKHFYLLINYNDFTLDLLDLLNKYGCKFYIYCSKSSKITGGNRLKNCNNYLTSEDFYNINQRIVNKWEKEDANVIKEHFNGMVTDRDFLEE